MKAEETAAVQFATIELHPGGHSYWLLLKCLAPGNFGLPRTVEKRRPERFQTIEAARRFALEELALDESRLELGAASLDGRA